MRINARDVYTLTHTRMRDAKNKKNKTAVLGTEKSVRLGKEGSEVRKGKGGGVENKKPQRVLCG